MLVGAEEGARGAVDTSDARPDLERAPALPHFAGVDWRVRGLTVSGVPELSSDGLDRLASLQSLTVRRWLAESPNVRHRTVEGSVLSADISGFTRLAERLGELGVRQAAESLNDTINRCFVPMIDEVYQRNGDVLKFGGDAIFALFEGPDHRRQASAAALNLQWLLSTVDLGVDITLSMTVGVASGAIPLSLVGRGRRELIVLGPVVDECLRLEADAEPGEVLISAETAAALPPPWVIEPEPGIKALSDVIAIDFRLPSETTAVPPLDLVDWPVVIGQDLAGAVDSFAGTAGEVRIVTIAFVFLPTDGLDPEAVAVAVERAMAICGRYGVTFLSTDVAPGGVKMLLSAGAPKAGDGDEDAMLGAMAELVLAEEAAVMRCGVNRGLVYVGFLGSPRCQTFTVMGDSTNLAARLLGKSVDRSVAVSQAVLDQARARYETVELAPVLVKGRIAPVTVHRLGTAAPRLRDRLVRPPFVGRTEELQRLDAALTSARAGEGSAIDITGEAGVGVSRLIEEFVSRLPTGILHFELAGHIAAQGRPFNAVRGLLRSVAAIPEGDDRAACGDALERWVARTVPELGPLVPLIAPALDADVAATTAAESIDAEFRQDRANDVIVELLAAALTVPIVITIGDLHWVDSPSRALLDAVATEAQRRPWLLVAGTRPGGDGLGRGSDDAERLRLLPLPADEALAVVAEVGDLPEVRRQEVVRRSGGNPLFAIELAQSAAANHDLLDSVEGLITAGIDRLGHQARVLARTAAVLGQRFSVEMLAEVLAADRSAADDSADDQADAGTSQVDLSELDLLITADDDGWATFRSEVIRDVAYRGLSGRRRRQLHTVVAEVLERREADIAELAWHHAQADNHEAAWIYSRKSAERSLRLGDMGAATDHLLRAVASADAAGPPSIEPEAVTEVLIEVFDAAEGAERYDEALAAGQRALQHVEDPVDRVRLLVRLTSTKAETDGSYGAGVEALVAELDTCGPGDGEARGWLGATLAGLYYRLDDRQRALATAETAVAAARSVGAIDPVPRALLIKHLILSDRADPDRGRAGAELIEAAEAAANVRILSSGHNNVGLDLQASGQWSEAEGHYEFAVKYALEIGDRYRALMPAINRATVSVDRGRWDDARVALDEQRRTAAHHRSGFLLAWVQRELGRLEVHAGQAAAGRVWLEAAEQWLMEAGIASSLYEVRLSRAAADLADGRSSEVLAALADLEPPSELASRQLGLRDTLAGYANLQRGDPEAGFEHLQRAVEATTDRYLFGNALALVGLSEAESFLGRGRSARRTREQADGILARLGVEALPVIPLPK